MDVAFTILFYFSLVVALVFAALIFLTSKGDAMSGGSNVRTTFKGKAGFDDFVSKLVIGLGAGFMALMIVLDVLSSRVTR